MSEGPGLGRRDGLVVAAAALAARLAAVAWAGGRFPAVADGAYYHKLAGRLAEGAGYTWLWPDGVVTFAAHYPVGYPFLLSLVYRLTGPSVVAAGVVNALLGALGAWAAHGLARRATGRWAALAGGLLCALDPALVLYTPALMTEGNTAALIAVSALLAAAAAEARGGRRAGLALGSGAVLGLATLVRPQCLLLAPLFGLCAGWAGPGLGGLSPSSWGGRLVGSAASSLSALAVCLPWTLRNCARMGKCALVSVNGGWNLLIGAGPNANGHWAPVDVPEACKTVFDEAGKDVCFGEAARQMIARDPWRWLELAPAKLSATFDYCGAAPWYLHDSNAQAFTYDQKVAAGALETGYHRLLLLAALVALGSGSGPRPWARKAVALLGAVFVVQREGYVGYLALVAVALLGLRPRLSGPALPFAAAAVVGTTALVHAAFFGAGRYSLPVFPLVAACAGAVLTGLPRRGDT